MNPVGRDAASNGDANRCRRREDFRLEASLDGADLLAGNVDIRLPDASAIGTVSAAVVSGGLTAKPWKVDKGGIVRTFERTGPGEFDLHAQVLAGQLTIR